MDERNVTEKEKKTRLVDDVIQIHEWSLHCLY